MKWVSLVILIFFGVFLPGKAFAETATVGLEVKPLSGSTLYKNAYTPVNWKLETLVSSETSSILPMIRADLRFPGAGDVTFNPNIPVCPDSKIGPGDDPGTVNEVLDLCRNAVLGHGSAKFALNRANIPSAILSGFMVIFNGGLVDGRPKIKVTAYSYDTSAGVYTEGILQENGEISFQIPRLTSDSAVISLNLEMPAKEKRVFLESKGFWITLPAGLDRYYVRARCSNGTLPLEASFLLGRRPTPSTIADSIVVDAEASETCIGASGAAKLGTASLTGPSSVKAGRKGTYTLTVKNTGASDARSISLRAQGRGVSGRAKTFSLMPATREKVKIPVLFKKKGKARVTFKASASGVKGVSISKTVRVR